jgi:hypothetical protein
LQELFFRLRNFFSPAQNPAFLQFFPSGRGKNTANRVYFNNNRYTKNFLPRPAFYRRLLKTGQTNPHKINGLRAENPSFIAFLKKQQKLRTIFSDINYVHPCNFYIAKREPHVKNLNAHFSKLGGTMKKKVKHKRRYWKKEEIRLIRKLFPANGPEKLAEMFGRTVAAVKQRAYSVGVASKSFRHWTAEETRLLKNRFRTADTKKLARRIGRPLTAVRQRAYDLGMKTDRYRFWSEADIKTIKKLYSKMTTAALAQKLGRSKTALRARAKKLGLKKSSYRHWSSAEVRFLEKFFFTKKPGQLAGSLGRSLRSVTNKARKLGLKPTRKP